IIVPALSVDKNHYRLGYGKGYYDRFLNNFSVLPKTLTPIFSELIIEKLPRESHDKKIDIIITD
ncbi:5-formyltetrahydrofolate cyclo-ligase, partial [bacterium]|nr:5-formyltetrahydrofolate cyclo-ligase [bacterium]